MFNYISKIVFSSIFLVLINGCANSPYLSKGKVISLENGSVVIRVEATEEAMIGRDFDVYRLVESDSLEEGSDIYLELLTGKVSVVSIVDNKFIKTKVLSGKIQKNDLIKL